MLRRPDIDHILRAAAVLSNHVRFVVVGTGAVIIMAKHIPTEMMMTTEIDCMRTVLSIRNRSPI